MGNSNEYQGYFLVNTIDESGRPIIDGVKPINAWNCGSCDRGQVYFVSWYKDGPIDNQDPHFATIVDFSLDAVDTRMQSPVVAAIYMQTPLPAETLPSVAALITQDRSEGLTPDQILEARAGILGDNFLGFTFDLMVAENPWIVQPVIDENEVEHPNVWKCNLGPTVES